MPTTRSQAPSADTVSVSDGSRLTMRRGDAASATVTPRLSRNSGSAAAAPDTLVAATSATTNVKL